MSCPLFRAFSFSRFSFFYFVFIYFHLFSSTFGSGLDNILRTNVKKLNLKFIQSNLKIKNYFFLKCCFALSKDSWRAFTEVFIPFWISLKAPSEELSNFLNLVFASIVGYFIFSETPDLFTWIGASVIFIGIFIISYREMKLDKEIIRKRIDIKS